MSGGVTITLHADRARAAFRAAARRCNNMAPVWEDIAMELEQSVQLNFKHGGRPTPWAPWSKPYAAWRAREHAGRGGVLRLSMNLVESINSEHNADSARVGTNVPYAAIHQLGGTTGPHTIRPKKGKALRWIGADGNVVFRRSVQHPGSKVPARPFLLVQEDDWDEFVRIAGDYISGPLAGQVV